MRRYTTPTLKVTIKHKDGTPATDLIFDYLIFTLVSGKTVIEREIPFSEFDFEASFEIEFSQEETGTLVFGSACEAQINIMANDKRIASSIKTLRVERNLHNEVILS